MTSDLDLERAQPNDALAEADVLGAMMSASRVIPDVVQIIKPEDFYVSRYQLIADAIYRLDAEGKPVTASSVVDALRASKQLAHAGGPVAVTDLAYAPTVPDAATHHAKRIAKFALQRRGIEAGMGITELSYSAEFTDPNDFLAAIQARVEAVASSTNQDGASVRVGDVLDDYLEVLETGEEPPGIAFHTADLRRDLRPLRPAQLAVIAAWSGVGKSIASWNYAAHAAIHEKRRVLFHALEMSREEMLDRLIAAEAKVDYGHITSRKMTDWDWEKITVARGRIEDADLHIDDTEGVSLAMLRASVRRVKPDLLVVDQIPIMTPPDPRAPREQQVAAISYGLKNLARAEGIAVVAVAQLNDEALKRADKRPSQHDLRESKAIVHASDLVVILHDEAHLEPESPRAGEIDWIVVKQRGGRKLTITLANQLAFQRHMDMAS